MIAKATFFGKLALELLAKNSRIRASLITALLVASIGGMLILLHAGVAGLPWQTLRARPGFLLLAFVATALASAGGAKYWQCLLSAVGVDLPVRKALRIWCLSNVAKYGLGAVTQYGGRLYMTEQLGLNRRSSAASIVLEVVLILGSGLMTLLFLAPLTLPTMLPQLLLPFTWLGPVAGSLVIGLFLLYSASFIRLLPNRLRPPMASVWRRKVGQALGIVAVNWILLGLSAFFVIQSIITAPLDVAPSVVFAVVFAMTSGLLALTPFGAGVREVTLALLLSHFVPSPVAVVVAVLHRLLTVLAELTLAVPIMVSRRVERRESSGGPATRPSSR